MRGIDSSSALANDQVLFIGAPITLRSVQVFTGSNIHHTTTVIRQEVDFGALDDATSEVAGRDFPQAFLDRFLSLESFLPNNGLKDTFIERLRTRGDLGFAEMLLEATLAVEAAVAFARHELSMIPYAEIRKGDGHTALAWASPAPRLSREAARIALQGLLEALPDRFRPPHASEELDFGGASRQLFKTARRRRLAPSTAVIKLAANRRGIPCEALGRQHLRLGQGNLQHAMYASMTETTSIAAQKLCVDKRQTNRRLSELRLPVPRQIKVGSEKATLNAAKKLGFPLVIKPVRGRKGADITIGIQTIKALASAFDRAHHSGSDVLVEAFIPGNDYRLLVVGGRFVAAVWRQPPYVSGDGKASIAELIEQLNADPYRDGFRGFPVTHDEELRRILDHNGLTLGTVLQKGDTLVLRAAANVSTGGIPIDVTDRVHPDNRETAERAATGVGLDVAGIDFLCTDISRSHREVGGAIIEINARPGIDIHAWPKIGKARDVASELLNLAFPDGATGRIPLVTVAGDKGTGSAARILDMILRGAGKSVGLALRSRSYIRGQSADLNAEQQRHAPLVLARDPDVETLICTVSPRQITRQGMLLEHTGITVIMDRVKPGNAESFHQGLDVVCRATSDSFVVGAGNIVALNKIATLNDKRVILIDERINNPSLQAHLKSSGEAVSTQWIDGEIRAVLLSGEQMLASIPIIASSPRDGRIRRQRLKIAMLYAIGAAYSLGLSAPEIQSAVANAPKIIPDESGLVIS